MSSLQSINGFNLDSDLVQKFLKDYTYLRMLDPIQNHALHLCFGAYRTSPASNLCVEANEPPLYFRRKKLQYCLKLSCKYSNPAYATVFSSKFYSVFERKPTQLPPLAIRVSGDLV